MKIDLGVLALAGLGLALAGCGSTRPPGASGGGVKIKATRTIQTPAGQESMIGLWPTVDKDCRPDVREVRLTQSAAHGASRLDKPPATLGEKELAACQAGEKPGYRLYYRPKAGFAGVDVLTVEVAHPSSGGRMDMTINVNVR